MLLLTSMLYGQNNDCNLALVLCDNINLTSNPDGSGFNDFSNPNNSEGCLVGFEHESEWYYFQIDPNAPADLELSFTISPNAGAGEDYDFAIYGPNANCNNLGFPLRCSYAATGCANCPETGLDSDATDNTEGAAGDGIVSPIIVQPGEGYFLLIDNFLATGQGFNMTWSGLGANWLDCTAEPPCAVNPETDPDFEACQGVGTISLNGINPGQNFNTDFTWSANGIGNDFIVSPNSQNTILNIPDDFSGTLNYTFTVQDGTCIDEAEIEINIIPGPILTVPLSTNFCINDTPFPFPISPEGGTWNSDLPNGIVDPSTLGVGTHSAVYSYTDQVTGCTIDENISINILAAPNPTVDPIASTCVGENSIALSASPIGGTWSDNAPNGILDPNFVGAGIHTIGYTIMDPTTGCSNTAIQVVEILELIDLEIQGNTVFCIGQSTTLSVNPNFETYLWSDNSTGNSLTTSITSTYTVTVTNSIGCVATAQVNTVEDDYFPTADAGSDLILDCAFNFIDIGGNSSIGNMNYNWSSNDPNLTIENSNNINASVNQAGIYQLLVTNNHNGCSAIDEMEVTNNTNFPTNASFDIDPLICYGDQDAILTISNVQNGMPPYSYSINQGNFHDNNSFAFLGSGTYTITVQDAKFCEWETTVEIPSPPEFSLNLGQDITISLGEEAELRVQPNFNLAEFQWQPDSTLPCIDCLNPTVNPIFQTTYFAFATSEEGCFTEEYITVFVKKDRNVFIQNAFSPNEDGQNDIYKIYGGSDVRRVNSFMIFNRWGEIIYEARNFDILDDKIGWNGNLNGRRAAQGVYVYVLEVEFVDGWTEIYRGDLTLHR